MTIMTKPKMEDFLHGLRGPWGEPDTMKIELGAIRRMALCVEDFNPIHFDERAARERGYRGIVAPWPLLWLMFFNCSEFEIDFPFGKATVHGEDKYEFHEAIIEGDEIRVRNAITETSVKEGKSGLMGLIVQERRFFNQLGQLCAVLATTAIRR
jgi:acyl dehydratase